MMSFTLSGLGFYPVHIKMLLLLGSKNAIILLVTYLTFTPSKYYSFIRASEIEWRMIEDACMSRFEKKHSG